MLDNNLEKIDSNIFENIKHLDENGKEYWLGRELGKILEYGKYRKFFSVIEKVIIACKNSNQKINDHFAQMDVMVEIGSNAKRKLSDYKLSRYAGYLIAQNADNRKK